MADLTPEEQQEYAALSAKAPAPAAAPQAASALSPDEQKEYDSLNSKAAPPPAPGEGFDNSATVERLHQNWARARLPETPGAPPREAKDVWEALHTGWEMGATSLATNYEARTGAPDLKMPATSTRAMRMMYAAGQFAGDVGPMLAAGSAAFTAAGGPADPAAPYAAYAAGGAFPAWVRRQVMDHYAKGDIKTFGEFFDRNSGAALDALKGAAAGITGAAAGQFIGTPLGQMAGAFLGRTGSAMMANATPHVVKAMTEAGAMTVMGSELDGKGFPNAEDFVFSTAMALGMHAVTGIAGGRQVDAVRRSYAQSGMPLDQMVQTILNDAHAKGELAEGKVPTVIANQVDQQIRAAGITIDRTGTLHKDGVRMPPLDAVAFGRDNPEALSRMQQNFRLNPTEPGNMFQPTTLEKAQKVFQAADTEAMRRVTEETTPHPETSVSAKSEKQSLYDNTENNPQWRNAHADLVETQAATLELPDPVKPIPAVLTKGSDMAPKGPEWGDSIIRSAMPGTSSVAPIPDQSHLPYELPEARFTREWNALKMMQATPKTPEPWDSSAAQEEQFRQSGLTSKAGQAPITGDLFKDYKGAPYMEPTNAPPRPVGSNQTFPAWRPEQFTPETSGGEVSRWPVSREEWERHHGLDELPDSATQIRKTMEANAVTKANDVAKENLAAISANRNPWTMNRDTVDWSKAPSAGRSLAEIAAAEPKPPEPASDPQLRADLKAGVPGSGEQIIENKINRDLDPIDPRTWKERAGEAWKKFRISAYDDQLPALSAAQTIAGKSLKPSESAFASQWRAQGGNWERSNTMLDSGSKNGIIDYKTGDVIPGSKTLEDVAKMAPDYARGERYMLARRTVEKGESVSGIPLAAAEQMIREHGEVYEPFAKAFTDWHNAIGQYAVDAGLFDKETWEHVKDENQDFVSFKRVFESIDAGGPQFRRGTNTPFKELTGRGGEFQIMSPMRQAIQKAVLFVRMAERNGAVLELARAAEANPEKAAGLFRIVDSKPAATGSQVDMVQDAVDHTLRAPQVRPGGNESEVFYKDNGVSKTAIVPKELGTMLNEMDRQTLTGPLGIAVRAGQLVAGAERFGVLNTPSMIYRHGFRNPIVAMMRTENSVGGLIRGVFQAVGEYSGVSKFHEAFIDTGSAREAFDAMMEAPKGEQTMGDRKAAGGGGDSVAEGLTNNYLQERLEGLIKTGGLQRGEWNSISSFQDLMSAASQIKDSVMRGANTVVHFTDNMIRQGDFNASKAAGFSSREAAARSRTVIPDLQRVGADMRTLNSVTPFFHTEWQSNEGLAAAMMDPAQRPRILAAGGIMAGVALANWMRNRNDSRIQALPAYRRFLFMNVPFDKWEPVDPSIPYAMKGAMERPDDQRRMIDGKLFVNNGPIIPIPKPFAMGIIFMSGIEATAEKIFNSNPHAFDGYGKALLAAAVHAPLPAILRPGLEQATNTSFQTGNPLVPAALEKELPALRYNGYTSDTAKALGKMIATVPYIGDTGAASPIVVDNWIHGWTGGIGDMLVGLADKGLRAAGKAPERVDPERPWSDNFFTRAFFTKYPTMSAQPIEAFRSNLREFEMIKASMNAMAASKDLTTAQQLLKQGVLQGYGAVDMAGTEKFISNVSSVIKSTYENPNIKPYEKQQMIYGLTYMASGAATKAQKALDQARSVAGGKQ